MQNMASSLPQENPRELHAVFGSGGTQALLAGTGSLLAFHAGGLTKWTSVGGASAGSMPAVLLAAGVPPNEFLSHVLETDFQKLLKLKSTPVGLLFALLRKYYYEVTRPAMGVYDPSLLREFIDTIVPVWPKNYWTVAACHHGQVLFTADGVYKYGAKHFRHQLSPTPPSVGWAVHASCAIPGILHAMPLHGENLFDGALSGDGDCPVGVVWRHFPGEDKKVFAVDVGEDPIKNWWVMRFLWNLFCGGRCNSIDGVRPEPREGLVIVSPRVQGFHSLNFAPSRGLKWQAILTGYQATSAAIQEQNLVQGDAAQRLQEFDAAFRRMQSHAEKPDHLIVPIERFLRQRKMLD